MIAKTKISSGIEFPRGSPATLEEYDALDDAILDEHETDLLMMSPEECEAKWKAFYRYRARTCLFYLLTDLLRRPDARDQWLLDRMNDIQENPNEHLDLYSREHYKSTIITFALTIQDILRTYGDDGTGQYWSFCIFSYVRPIAKDFLVQIKRECEMNSRLYYLFPDIFWEKPNVQAPKWSDEAIELRRPVNRREATVEGWGLYEGQPTSRHFDVRIYDDAVTKDTVKTEERIRSTIEYWELSLNMGNQTNISRYTGTRYSYNDPYHEIMKRKAVRPRLHPATDDGTFTGTPVFWSEELFEKKVREMGKNTASCQLLQNPLADTAMGFDINDWRTYDMTADERHTMAKRQWRILLCDPASGKKRKGNDYTSMGVFSAGEDNNFYLLDGVRDKLRLSERTDALFRLHREWQPQLVGYEESGMAADIEHIQSEMKHEGYHFDIYPLGGKIPKMERISGLEPLFEAHKLWFPRVLKVKMKDNRVVDLVTIIRDEEILLHPVALHDDWMDMMARLADPDVKKRIRFPGGTNDGGPKELVYNNYYA